MSAYDIQNPVSLPSECLYQLPASLPPAKNIEIRNQPINGSSFGSGNVIQIDLNAGNRSMYLDTTTSYIRYKITYAITSGSTAGTDLSALMGSAYSPFLRQEVYSGSTLLESINEVGVLVNMMGNMTLNDADKRGLSPAFGYSDLTTTAYYSSCNMGHQINKTATNQALIFEYAIPVFGILGNNTDKFFPCCVNALRLELTCDSVGNFTKRISSGAFPLTSYTISEFEFVGNYVAFESEPAQQILAQAQNGKLHIRTSSYRQVGGILPASSGSGSYDILVPIRVSSLKSMFVCCSPSNAYEGKYSGVNPNLDQGTCLVVSGTNIPSRTLSPSAHPADAYMSLQKSIGALSFSVFNGCISRDAWMRNSTAFNQTQAYNATANDATGYTAPNMFYVGIDTEIVARKNNLLSGINVNTIAMYFRAQVGSALSANQHTLNFYGYYDLILELDINDGSIVAKY
jgi:hypothetical protein